VRRRESADDAEAQAVGCGTSEIGVDMSQAGGITRRRRGLTVIEMVMVIAVIGIMAAVAVPKFNINRYRADGAGRLGLILLQEAQRNAITRQSNVIVSFDSAYNRLRVVQDYNNNDTINTGELIQYRKMADGARFAKPNWSGAVGADGATPSGAVTGTGLMTISGFPTVIFRRDGSASGNVRVFITTNVGFKTEFRELIVTQSTGRTDLYKFNGSSWIQMNNK
jgi:prepilin-type N-terminal cleavage/methylation domain-containing protein